MPPRDLSKLSGEDNFERAPQLVLNQLRINGKKGIFEFRDIKKGLVAHPKDATKQVYETLDLGPEISVILFRIRRKMVEKMKERPAPGGPRPAYSQEHSAKYDTLYLTSDAGVVVGGNDELRARFPDLRTQQILYALYNGEIVRIIFKGASLGSQSKAKDVSSFYDYIASFQTNAQARDGIKDHFYDFNTRLLAIEEISALGEYYTIDFKRGKAVNDKEHEQVIAAMEAVDDFVMAHDMFYAKQIQKVAGEVKVAEEKAAAEFNSMGEPPVPYPEGDGGETPF